jgi:hypothetical protein
MWPAHDAARALPRALSRALPRKHRIRSAGGACAALRCQSLVHALAVAPPLDRCLGQGGKRRTGQAVQRLPRDDEQRGWLHGNGLVHGPRHGR